MGNASTSAPALPVRLFLDSGVILEGCYGTWGSAKAVLILAAQRRKDFHIVLAEAVEGEVRRDLVQASAALAPERATTLTRGFEGWLARVRIERHPLPTEAQIRAYYRRIMPVLRHDNDLLAVIIAILGAPDWVLSTNTRHWNAALAERAGLRIATPQAFLEQLHL